jgi:competence protein ComEC
MNWRNFPLLKILIGFIAGIIVSICFPEAKPPPFWLLIAILALMILHALYQNVKYRFRFDLIFGVLSFSLFLVFGWQRSYYKGHFIEPDHFSLITNVVAYSGYIEEDPVEKARSWKSTICVEYVKDSVSWHAVRGKLICYFSKDSAQILPKTGKRILFFAHPDEIPASLNPYAFDYREYLKKLGIAHRVYLSSQNWTVSEGKTSFSIKREALKWRGKLLDILENSRLTEAEFGVASAILLGYDDKLDPELRNIYANVGAAHILCVSGMHVGVVFMIFSVLLSFLTRTKKGKIIRTIILLILIWAYACITGLAPAVSRASAMISFMIVAQATGRRNNTWNAIIASSLFLLIGNPSLLTDVGFQLSYAAVIAIIALQKPIYNLIYVKTWLGDQIWSLMAVSIAAQLGTAPIAMYYFHQFPNWFLLTNLIVIPSSSLIIYTGVAALIFSFIPFLKEALSWLLFYEIRILNIAMEWIGNLPHAVITGINIALPELFFIFIFLIADAFCLLQKNGKAAIVSLCALFMCMVSFVAERFEHENQSELIFFEGGRSSVIGLTQGREIFIITDSTFMQNENSQSFVINSYITRKGIKKVSFISDADHYSNIEKGISVSQKSLLVRGKRIFIIEKPSDVFNEPLRCDYLVVRNGYYGDPDEWIAPFDCEKIIIESSNSRAMQEKWVAAKSAIPKIHILSRNGALVEKY